MNPDPRSYDLGGLPARFAARRKKAKLHSLLTLAGILWMFAFWSAPPELLGVPSFVWSVLGIIPVAVGTICQGIYMRCPACERHLAWVPSGFTFCYMCGAQIADTRDQPTRKVIGEVEPDSKTNAADG